MTGQLGHLAIAVAAGASVTALVLALRPGRATPGARAALLVAFGALAVASALLGAALLRADMGLRYIAGHVEPDLPPFYRLTALWSGSQGSLLVWGMLLAGVGGWTCTARANGPTGGERIALGIAASLDLFFCALLLTIEDPFAAIDGARAGGHGLNPALQHWAMAAHPPMLLLGTSLTAGAFLVRCAAFTSRETGTAWLAHTRRWTLAAWTCLTGGIALGAFWAYAQLGWGGYWNFDPVENCSLMVWLMCTALLHATRTREGNSASHHSVSALATAPFLLAIFGTFVTRSGVMRSAHTYAGSPGGYAFLALLGALIALVAVLAARSRRSTALRARSEGEPARDRFVSGATGLLVALAGWTMVATLVPLGARLITGRALAVSPVVQGRVAGGAAAGVVLLLALYAAVARVGRGQQRGVAASAWAPRRIGALIAHVGVVSLIAGVAGSSLFARTETVSLRAGESASVRAGALRVASLRQRRESTCTAVEGTLVMTPTRGSEVVLTPSVRFFPNAPRPLPRVALRSSLAADMYVTLTAWEPAGAGATVEVRTIPLTIWIWIGAGLMALGGVVCLVPAWSARIVTRDRRAPAGPIAAPTIHAGAPA